MVYIPDLLRIASLSLVRLSMSGSASSNLPYMTREMPTANPLRIFSCCLHVLNGTGTLAPQLTEPHGQASSLPSRSIVLEEAELGLLIHISPVCAHGSQPQARASRQLLRHISH